MNLSCNEATTICDKGQYGEITFWAKIQLSWHLLLCRKCGKYSKQNGIMTKCYKNQTEISKKNNCCLSEKEKMTMDKELKEKI